MLGGSCAQKDEGVACIQQKDKKKQYVKTKHLETNGVLQPDSRPYLKTKHLETNGVLQPDSRPYLKEVCYNYIMLCINMKAILSAQRRVEALEEPVLCIRLLPDMDMEHFDNTATGIVRGKTSFWTK